MEPNLIAGIVLVGLFIIVMLGLLVDGGTRTMALRGLKRNRKSTLMTVFALAIGTAVIMSSLAVGDALKGFVVQKAESNLSNVDVLVISADFANASIVEEISVNPTVSGLCDDLAPALVLPVVLHNDISGRTISRATLYALDPQMGTTLGKFYWSDGGERKDGMPLEEDRVLLNKKAARELDAYSQQPLTIGLDSPALRKESMFTVEGVDHVNLTISRVLDDEGMGRLQFNVQDVRPAAFTTLDTMNKALKVENRMNAILVSVRPGKDAAEARGAVTNALDEVLAADDLHLKVETVSAEQDVPSHIRVTSDRVFFDGDTIEWLRNIDHTDRSLISTYFVDSLTARNKNGTSSHLSYSTVTGFDPSADSAFGLFTDNVTKFKIMGSLKPDQIGITNWTAKELGVVPGDNVTLNYSIMDDHMTLIPHSRNFTVGWVVDIVGKAADPTLMPDFPGIEGIESCFKWDPPFPMDMSSIQPKDEHYWKVYRGIPKAYVMLSDAEAMWGNDQGNHTMIKLASTKVDTVEESLDRTATARTVGMSVTAIKDQLVSSASAMDIFLQMFIAFGTLTIAAAVLFVASTFNMMIAERRPEIGAMLSIGISRRKVVQDLLAEGAVYSLLGGLVGLVLGWLAAGALVLGLDTVWSSMVGGQQVVQQAFLPTYISPGTVTLSLGAGAWISLMTLIPLAVSAGKISVMEARGQDAGAVKARGGISTTGLFLMVVGLLLVAGSTTKGIPSNVLTFIAHIGLVITLWGAALIAWTIPNIKWRSRLRASALLLGLLSLVTAAAGAYYHFQEPPFSALGLFVVDGLFITISLFATLVPLIWMLPKGSTGSSHVVAMSFMRGNGRRTASTIGVFALIIFSVISLSVIIEVQNSALANAADEQGGGFDVLAEATRPIGPDLSDPAARAKAGVDISVQADIYMVRTVGTSGAVCSNMNPQYPPRLIGADDRLIAASDFKVQSSLLDKDTKSTWTSLDMKVNGRIPILVDENTLIIYLGYAAYEGALGHVFTIDTENGKAELEVVGILAPSVIAGSFVMHEDFLEELYPTGSGHRLVLAGTNSPDTLVRELERDLADHGLDARTVEDIVRETTSAEQGYMRIFQAYLGAGLVLGVVALAVTQAREVMERKRDIAMLRAVGLSRGSIGRLFYIEALAVGGLSLAIGLTAGLLLAQLSGPAWGRGPGEAIILPVTFLITFSLALIAIILASAHLPASRASKLAPAFVLREEG